MIASGLPYFPLLSDASKIYAETKIEKALAGTISGTYSLDMWHYSGGYWKVGNSWASAIRFNDSEIDGNISNALVGESAGFTASVSSELAGVLSGVYGSDYVLEWGKNYDDYYDEYSYGSFPSDLLTVSGTTATITLTPKFNLSGDTIADLSGISTSKTIPAIAEKYGCNIYSVFGNGVSAVQVNGSLYEKAGYIHPEMIKNSKGQLKSGYQIRVSGNLVDSDGYSIGSGTFSAAGACGLHFSFPLSIKVYKLETVEIPDPPQEPEETIPTGPAIEPPIEEPEPEPEKPAVTGLTASLSAPKQTYVGHKTVLYDASVYQLDGESYSASRAIEMGLGKNSFSIAESGCGSVHKTSTTKANAVFTKPGTFTAKLTETASSGEKDTDTKKITVLKTPYIISTVGGSQKENRKQLLQISVAQNPSAPVNFLEITIKDSSSGESITVKKSFTSAENAPSNSEHIKYRSLEDAGSDEYFINAELPFLTKWHTVKALTYSITAKDTSGSTDTYSGSFEVLPDNPPAAAIGIEDTYYRGEKSNQAEILVKDISSSDGDDLERTWYVKSGSSYIPLESQPGFSDKSFGKKQAVTFLKTGVGEFDVKLFVKDKWLEETLPEYIKPSDYLTAEAYARSKVDNIAPIVSLELMKNETASVFILADNEALKKNIDTKLSDIRAALISKGIDADIKTDYRQPEGTYGESKELVTGGTGGRSFRTGELTIQSNYWTGMWKGGNGYSDDHNAYILLGTYTLYPGNNSYSIEDYPYTIRAYNCDGSIKWNASVTKAILPTSDCLASAKWGKTLAGEYIYLTESGKTAIWNAQSGAYITTLECELGESSVLTDEYIYTFKSDGIYRISTGGGSLAAVFTCSLSCPQYINGTVQFCFKKAVGSGLGLARGVLNLKTGEVSYYILEGSCGASWTPGASFTGLDTAGCIFAQSGNKVYCFDKDNALIKEITLSLIGTSITAGRCFPVFSPDGKIEYIGETGRSKSGTSSKGYKYHTYCNVHGVYTDEDLSDSKTSGADYLNYGYPVISAQKDANGAIGIYLGGAYIFNSYERYLSSLIFSFRGSYSQKFGFPMEEGRQGIHYVTAAANLGGHDDIKQIIYTSEGRDAETNRLKTKYLDSSADYRYFAEYKAGSSVESIINEIIACKERGIDSLAVSSDSGSAVMSLDAELAADTIWYYEYDSTLNEDILSASCRLTNEFTPQAGYTVEKEFIEDFDDSEINNFFTVNSSALNGCRYRIGYLYTSKRDSNALQTGSSYPVTFTVPAGKEAVLSFDYDYKSESSGNSAAYLNIAKDGVSQPWEMINADTVYSHGSGTYMHSKVLGPGTYSISCVIRDYTSSSKHENYFYIDNLAVRYIKAGSFAEGNYAPAKSAAVSENSGGMYHVLGSFKTPVKTLYLGKYDCEYVSGLNNTYASYTTVDSGYSRTVTETITIPSGRKALYSALTITGKGARYSSRDYSANWTLDGNLLASYHPSPSGSDYLRVVPSPYTAVTRGTSGSHVYKATANTRYGTSASAADLQLFISKPGASIPSGINSGVLFTNAGSLYGEASKYTGITKVMLSPSKDAVIRNFKLYTISNGKKVYAKNCYFNSSSDVSNWNASGCTATVKPYKQVKEEPAMVYAKGETVNYQIFYSDYENDPSKRQYWLYEHEPMNDGLHPKAGLILSAPIQKFYVDGKYTVTHWQQDNTGNAAYDKDSNKVSITFYIQGTATAPWVKSITTNPAEVESGSNYKVRVAVDDAEKDPLDVIIEVYYVNTGELAGTKKVTGLAASGDDYPVITFDTLPKAKLGTYDVIVRVSDPSGTGLGNYRFVTKEGRRIEGYVTHTQAWENNRQLYNLQQFGNKYQSLSITNFGAYRALSYSDRHRGTNVFWPGEKLMLRSETLGNPSSVKAQIVGTPYSTALAATGEKTSDNEKIYTGSLWDAAMESRFAATLPEQAVVRFTAVYPDGTVLTADVPIIFDKGDGLFWKMHKN